MSLYLPEVSEACLPPSHLGLTTPTEDTRRAAPPSAASTPALEILPAPSPGSPKGFHGVNVTTSVARKWEKKTTDLKDAEASIWQSQRIAAITVSAHLVLG